MAPGHRVLLDHQDRVREREGKEAYYDWLWMTVSSWVKRGWSGLSQEIQADQRCTTSKHLPFVLLPNITDCDVRSRPPFDRSESGLLGWCAVADLSVIQATRDFLQSRHEAFQFHRTKRLFESVFQSSAHNLVSRADIRVDAIHLRSEDGASRSTLAWLRREWTGIRTAPVDNPS